MRGKVAMFIVGLIGIIYWTIGKLEVVVATIQEGRTQKKELQIKIKHAAYKVEIKLELTFLWVCCIFCIGLIIIKGYIQSMDNMKEIL